MVLASEAPQAQQQSLQLVDDVVATRKDGLRLLNELADALGMHTDKTDVPALVRLSQVFQGDFALRRGVVQALCKIQHADALDVLIDLLAKSEGLIRADIVSHLTAATKQTHERDAAAWATWWQANKASFRYPATIARPDDAALGADRSSTYYGLPVDAGRLVFVIDTSGSMKGGKLEAAQRELNKAIAGLPETSQFAVVAFDSQVTA